MSVDKKELESFIAYYEKFWKKLPAIKTQAIYAAGKALQEEVRQQIPAQGVNDPFGRVDRWQQLYLGSLGGYSAVRSVTEHTEKTWRGKEVFSSQITRWLEKGHGVRKNHFGYSSASVGYVEGHLFYSWAKSKGADKALDAAARELDRITDEWEWE